MSDDSERYEPVRILVETEERAITGTIYKPIKGEGF